MKKALVYRVVEPACSQVGRATQSTATFLAILCFFFSIAFAAFAPVAPEERFLVFCCAIAIVLAIGLYMGGYILRQTLWLSDKLSEIMKARCVRLLATFANETLGCRVQILESLLNESEFELDHLRGEIEIARKAEGRSAQRPHRDRWPCSCRHPKPRSGEGKAAGRA